MLQREGIRPLEYMERLGWTGSDVWFAHGIHFNDEELRVLAKNRHRRGSLPHQQHETLLRHRPDPGDAGAGRSRGTGRGRQRLQRRLQPYGGAAGGLPAPPPERQPPGPTGYDVLKMATRGSARLLGRDDIGQLAVGKCADLFMIDSRRLELVGSCFDPKSVLGTVGVRGPVDYTVVHGRVTVAQGHLMTVDEERLAQDAETCCRQYLAR